MKIYEQARTGAVQRAQELRRDSTDAEKRMWRALRSKLPQHKWRREMPVGPCFADFACFAERLILELDGGQHASDAAYDARRARFLQSEGFHILRFWNNDVLTNTDGVLDRIAQSLSHWEREGAAKRRKGEAEVAPSSSPSHAFGAGPSLSQGRGVAEQGEWQ